MASITIRNLDDALESRLHVRAVIRNRSTEDEAMIILRNVPNDEAVDKLQLGSAIHALFAPLGGLDLPAIEREPIREPRGVDA